jgi:opacity protein-like surface antigen
MFKKLLSLASLTVAFAMLASAADVTGKWIAQVPGRDGQTRETTYNFKADGATLTGTMSGFQGGNDINITDGKVDGDKIAFVVKLEFNGNAVEMKYSGVLAGDEIKMKRTTQRGEQEFTAKRAK